ncbi:MAG: NAD-dependent epimerase/dehydratase family protein [Patescibacteria group bacterium]
MKCLVTGGAGFIGSHLVDKLIKERHGVAIIDNLSSGRKENLNPKAKFYKFDICDPAISRIFRKEKPVYVFHFAAHIEARESVKDPIFDAKINILGSLNILENCRKFNVKKIIFASSGGEIYGDAKKIPTPENYPPAPLSPYGISKLAVEKYLDAYRRLFGISYLALRFGNIYGPRQNPNGEAGVMAIFISKMLKKEQPLIHGDGKQTKDYIFIEDAINASFSAFKNNYEGIINIGTGKETDVLDIFTEIKKLTNSSVGRKHIASPACGFKRGCLSVRKAKNELGWRPKFNIKNGLKKTVEWYLNNK